jgi:hypothetical protein
MVKRFKAKLGSTGPGSLFIEVPFDVKAAFGKARPPVVVVINKHSYRSTIAVYGGRSYVPVRKSNRDTAGVQVGDLFDVSLDLDREPRVVEVPRDLAKALKAHPKARQTWAMLSYSHQKEHAEAIANAKKPETRAARIQKTLKMLGELV